MMHDAPLSEDLSAQRPCQEKMGCEYSLAIAGSLIRGAALLNHLTRLDFLYLPR
jgi:hypothetical protein